MYKNKIRRLKVLAPLGNSQNRSTVTNDGLPSQSVLSSTVASTLPSPLPVVPSHTENLDPGVSPAKRMVNFLTTQFFNDFHIFPNELLWRNNENKFGFVNERSCVGSYLTCSRYIR